VIDIEILYLDFGIKLQMCCVVFMIKRKYGTFCAIEALCCMLGVLISHKLQYSSKVKIIDLEKIFLNIWPCMRDISSVLSKGKDNWPRNCNMVLKTKEM